MALTTKPSVQSLVCTFTVLTSSRGNALPVPEGRPPSPSALKQTLGAVLPGHSLGGARPQGSHSLCLPSGSAALLFLLTELERPCGSTSLTTSRLCTFLLWWPKISSSSPRFVGSLGVDVSLAPLTEAEQHSFRPAVKTALLDCPEPIHYWVTCHVWQGQSRGTPHAGQFAAWFPAHHS